MITRVRRRKQAVIRLIPSTGGERTDAPHHQVEVALHFRHRHAVAKAGGVFEGVEDIAKVTQGDVQLLVKDDAASCWSQMIEPSPAVVEGARELVER